MEQTICQTFETKDVKMNEPKIDSSLATKSDYELMSNGSSASLSLNDSYSWEYELASGSSVRSSFGDCPDENCHTAIAQFNANPRLSLSSTMNLPVVSLVNEAWEYRGEGGANLVISVIGRRKIIRFKKT